MVVGFLGIGCKDSKDRRPRVNDRRVLNRGVRMSGFETAEAKTI
jgi:hypothetical protein